MRFEVWRCGVGGYGAGLCTTRPASTWGKGLGVKGCRGLGIGYWVWAVSDQAALFGLEIALVGNVRLVPSEDVISGVIGSPG